MNKKPDSTPDIFVKKLVERMGKIITRDELFRIWLASGGSKSRIQYGITQAKNRDAVTSLGGNIFVLGNIVSFDTHYWSILHALIGVYAPSGAIIGHEKAMECYLKNYEIPQTILLYTKSTNKRVKIGEYEFHFRSCKSGEKTGGKNMFTLFQNHSVKMQIDGGEFSILSLDAALLDGVSLRVHESGYREDLLLRFIRKYESRFSREALGMLVAYKYIRAMNRVRSFSKAQGFQTLYEMSLDIIKREGGGCYLNI